VHLRAVASQLDAELVIGLRWRAGDLDRLMDEAHARLMGVVATMLRRFGWLVQLEVTYSIYGERGSIDILAWHQPLGVLLVVEVKTELTSVEATLRKLGEKTRLAAQVAASQFGWKPTATGRLLVLPSLSTSRRQVARHAAVLGTAFPVRGPAARQWLAMPVGSASALVFLVSSTRRPMTRRTRVRPTPAAAHSTTRHV